MGRRHEKRRPARGAPTRERKRRLLVVTEGEVTEPQYLHAFSREHRSLVDVEVAGGEGDPKHVVERAIELRTEDRRTSGAEAFDEVWVAFDRDEHFHFKAAIDRAHATGLGVAASNPCVELWLLLHFVESPGPQDRKKLQAMLEKRFPGAGKRVRYEEDYRAHYELAAARAARLQRNADDADDPHRNPTTGFHLLTEAIRKAGDG